MKHFRLFTMAVNRLSSLLLVSAIIFMPLSNYNLSRCNCSSGEIHGASDNEPVSCCCAESAAPACDCAKEGVCSCDFTPDTHPLPVAAGTAPQLHVQNTVVQPVTVPIDYSAQLHTFRKNSLLPNEHQTVAPHVRVTVLRV